MPERLSHLLLAAALGFGPAAAAMAEPDAARGEAAFAQCRACHEVGEGARNRVGPHLNDLFGRRAGALEDFRYSPAMRTAGQEGLSWDADTLSRFIENPREVVPRSRMSFPGMSDAGERADLIAYLKGFSGADAVPDTVLAPPEVALDPEILAIEGDPAYGEYLSSECTTCHQSSGADEGIPSIVGWPREDFVIAMHAYKAEVRDNPVMQLVTSRLSDEEIAALAAYFAELGR